MKKLGLVLALLAVLLVVALGVGWFIDSKARALAEAEAEKRILESIPGTRSAEVEIHGFPFLFDVLVGSHIDELHVRLDDVRSPGIEVESIELTVDDLRIDRDLLLDQQKLAITGIAKAELVGRITGPAASAALRQTIAFEGSTVKVEYAGTALAADVKLRGRQIVIELKDGAELARRYYGVEPRMVVPLPPKDVLPCEPGLAVKDSRLELRCSVTELPASVKKAIGQR
jgi:hypothetical protein